MKPKYQQGQSVKYDYKGRPIKGVVVGIHTDTNPISYTVVLSPTMQTRKNEDELEAA